MTLDKTWVSSWDLSDWKLFIQQLSDLEIDTIMIYFNGHILPYKSDLYPELVDINHKNIQIEFLPELLRYIKHAGIRIIAVITTTGHAAGFSEISPESKIEIQMEDVNIEDTLVSFPTHIRKGKASQKSGAAQVGWGVLCHNKKTTQVYAENILTELINLYGEYFDGIALHPPEAIYPCQCETCCSMYAQGNYADLNQATLMDARTFFISSYLKYQNEILIKMAKTLAPSCKILTFTVPWLFESNLKSICPFISTDTTIIDWDYNLDYERVSTLADRISQYKVFGYNLWFMPSTGTLFSKDISEEEQIESVHTQIEIAEESGAEAVIHFLGPKLTEYLISTSKKNLTELKSKTLKL